MCTAFSKNYYFGRNLDVNSLHDEKLILTSRNYPLTFRYLKAINKHYAYLGIGLIRNEYALYYDGFNENGVVIAGLNLPDYTFYAEYDSSKNNLCVFEVIPYILATCKNMEEVKCVLSKINLTNTHFSEDLKTTPLHFMISFENKSIVLESKKEGVKVYENIYNVLTNAPSFDKMIKNIETLKYEDSVNRFRNCITLINNQIYEYQSIFEILTKVSKNNSKEKTVYSSVIDLKNYIYYYRLYKDSTVKAINMHDYDLNSTILYVFSL